MASSEPHVSISITPAESSTFNRNGNGNGRRSRSVSRENRNFSPNRRTTSRSPIVRERRDTASALDDAEPLLETDNPQRRPPLAGPEFEDDAPDDDIPYTPEARPGVDDSFFPTSRPFSPSTPQPQPGQQPQPGVNGNDRPTDLPPNGFGPGRRDSFVPTFPYAPEFGPGVVVVPGEVPQIIPDVNVYQHKKTLAQGMMDLALLSANANQLRYVLESYNRHPYYYFSVVFISISLILQVAVGIGLILNSRYNIKNQDDICKADKINNFTIIGIFLVTTVNVFISAFGVANPPADMLN